LMMGSRRLSWSSNTWSGLRCGKRHDKNATPSCLWNDGAVLVEPGVDDLSIRAGDIWNTLCAVLFQVIKKMAQETVFKRHLESFHNQERVLQVRRSRRLHDISTGRVTSACRWRRPMDGSVGQSAGPLDRLRACRSGKPFSLWEGIALPGCEDMANGKNVLLRQLWLQDETYRPINHDHCSNMRIRVAANGALSKPILELKPLNCSRVSDCFSDRESGALQDRSYMLNL
jgi:hypothetical protein